MKIITLTFLRISSKQIVAQPKETIFKRGSKL